MTLFSLFSLALFAPAARASGTCNADVNLADQSDLTAVGSIAHCIDSLRASGGGTVLLGAGTYRTAGSIALYDGITVQGASRSSTIVVYDGTGAHDLFTTAGRTVDDLTLRDMTVRGGLAQGQSCVQLNDASGADTSDRITLRNLVVEDCGQHGVYIKGANGVYLAYSVIQNNGLSATADHNVNLSRVNNVKIEYVTLSGASASGLHMADGEDVVIRQTVSEANGLHGVRINASQYVRLVGDTVLSNGTHGVYVRDDSSRVPPASDFICLRSSTLDSNGVYGVNLRSVPNYEALTLGFANNGTADALYYQSTSVSGVCNLIPRDSSVFPFTR